MELFNIFCQSTESIQKRQNNDEMAKEVYDQQKTLRFKGRLKIRYGKAWTLNFFNQIEIYLWRKEEKNLSCLRQDKIKFWSKRDEIGHDSAIFL